MKENVSGWISSSAFTESNLDYDLNGNIRKLTRTGIGGLKIDDLKYEYRGNQILSVSEQNGGDKLIGFVDGNVAGSDYAYDANGNMVNDLNKSIGSSLNDLQNRIAYNHMNLVGEVTRATQDLHSKLSFQYDSQEES